MFQSKREEVLQTPLIEFAKQVAFPDWNVMHGAEKSYSRSGCGQKTYVKESNSSDTNGVTVSVTSVKDESLSKESQDIPNCTSEISITVTLFDSTQEEVPKIQTEGDATACHFNNSNPQTPRDNTDAGEVTSTNSSPVNSSTSQFFDHEHNDTEPHGTESEPSAFAVVSGHEQTEIQNSVHNLRCSRQELLTRSRSHPEVSGGELCEKSQNKTSSDFHLESELRERRFRKKSMSFAGVLPIRIEVIPDEAGVDSNVGQLGRSREQRVNGIEVFSDYKPPKSPRRTKKITEKKSNDPSHYLGRRRGSYNPCYDQTVAHPVLKTKERHQRAKSLFVGSSVPDDEFRQSLASRLMKVASPALRESLNEEISNEEQQSKHEGGGGRVCLGDSDFHEIEEEQKSTLCSEEKPEMERRSGAVKAPRTGMRRRPWEDIGEMSSSTTYFNGKGTKFEDNGEKRSAYFSVASNRRALEIEGLTNGSDSLHPNKSQNVNNAVNSISLKHAKKAMPPMMKNRSDLQEGSLMERYHRQSRSRSCFGSLRPSLNEEMGLLYRKSSQGQECCSSSSSEDEEKENISIHEAAKAGKLQRIKRLVEDGLDVNVLDESNWPPIHYALLGGHFNCVAYLLTKGADIRHYSKGRTLKYFR